ncbi:MAG: crossover junction endodeoxyribonuclease RuvC [Limisphaerales bacterium]
MVSSKWASPSRKLWHWHKEPFPVRRRGPHSRCQANISQTLRDVLREYQPTVCAIEGLFFAQNLKTAIIMGEARGAAMAAIAGSGLDIYEIAPRKVKLAIVGYGAAQKTRRGQNGATALEPVEAARTRRCRRARARAGPRAGKFAKWINAAEKNLNLGFNPMKKNNSIIFDFGFPCRTFDCR